MTALVYITHDGQKNFIVKVPYNRDFIEALKDYVVPADRKYNPEDKTWIIKDEYWEDILELLDEFYGDYVLV